ncbi:hypothetical protein ACFQUU_26405 [Herbaspirillum sp. GCM10030257]|uniref:hypothetical protein n=1 Tax=Herbaspirillum sp. GCM10030257 TaxID=3273393 RepID=UPI0036142528
MGLDAARARPGLGISVPVAWDELNDLTSGAHWTVASAATRFPIGNTPLAEYESSAAQINEAIEVLGLRRPAPGRCRKTR